MSRLRSWNGLPVRAASTMSRLMMSKRSPNLSSSSSCHCSTRLPGRDDEAAIEVAAQHQLADVEARHDRLAGAGVVGEQEPQRLQRQEPAVDRLDLVRQRLDRRRLDRGERIEQVRQLDAAGLGRQFESGAVGVEGPAAPVATSMSGASDRR